MFDSGPPSVHGARSDDPAAWENDARTSLLFGVAPTDPATYGAVTAALLAVAWLACWVPAARAARVKPSLALQAE